MLKDILGPQKGNVDNGKVNVFDRNDPLLMDNIKHIRSHGNGNAGMAKTKHRLYNYLDGSKSVSLMQMARMTVNILCATAIRACVLARAGLLLLPSVSLA